MLRSKQEIELFVNRIGQPEASVILNCSFNSFRSRLTSADVVHLYDEQYRNKIDAQPAFLMVRGEYKINVYTRYAYEYLVPRLNATSRILDIGCGSGDFCLAVASNNVKEVVGIDFSRLAVERAQSKREKSGLENCRFIVGDVRRIEQEAPYDFIVMNDVVEHLSDVELSGLFARFSGLLAGGGEVLIHSPNGLALCNDTDRDIVQTLYKGYLRWTRGWKGFERTVEQLYYDQAHINIKSFRKWRKFLGKFGFRSKVFYDDRQAFSFLNRLSPNMLIVATGKR